jgi:hypothetical protein
MKGDQFLARVGGKSLEAAAELADDARLGDVSDEEAVPGAGASHIDEILHWPLPLAVHRVRLPRSRPGRMSIRHGWPQSSLIGIRCSECALRRRLPCPRCQLPLDRARAARSAVAAGGSYMMRARAMDGPSQIAGHQLPMSDLHPNADLDDPVRG